MNIIKRSRKINWGNRPSKSNSFKIGSLNLSPSDTLEVTVNITATNEKGIFHFYGKDLQKLDNIHCYLNQGETINKLHWSGAQPFKKTIDSQSQHIVFLRVAWMKKYQGVTEEDLPKGAGWYVNEHLDGGEVYNYLPIQGYYYGFSRIQKAGNLRLERLQKPVTNDKLDNVTVVLFAKHPSTGGEFIVGFYNNATLHRNVIDLPKGTRKDKPFYLFKAKTKDCTLIPHNKRLFELPSDGPGQSNVWYAHEYHDQRFLKEVTTYINDPDGYTIRKKGKKINHPRWQIDAEKRKKVELAAMELTSDYFTNLGYNIDDVHTRNVGWDMEASKGNQKLLLEIKGLSGPQLTVELSANEYTHSKKNKQFYRICIVNNALEKKNSKLYVFAYKNNCWLSDDGLILKDTPKISAIFNADL
jgi:hypothetical protein